MEWIRTGKPRVRPPPPRSDRQTVQHLYVNVMHDVLLVMTDGGDPAESWLSRVLFSTMAPFCFLSWVLHWDHSDSSIHSLSFFIEQSMHMSPSSFICHPASFQPFIHPIMHAMNLMFIEPTNCFISQSFQHPSICQRSIHPATFHPSIEPVLNPIIQSSI